MRLRDLALNKGIKISPDGRPYVETAELVRSQLTRIGADKSAAELARLKEEIVEAAKRFVRDFAWSGQYANAAAIEADKTLHSAVDALAAFEDKEQ